MQQNITIAHLKSDLCSINNGVAQGSVLRPILFLLYINDLNQAILHSKLHHFADDTNFLYASHSLKKLNKTTNFKIKIKPEICILMYFKTQSDQPRITGNALKHFVLILVDHFEF